ncbi:roadblock/LC7 domain-containing protein [Verrucomicrobiales bacterium BCK34]|nr:roadblock/LC7 domain-containing protein [Verrucomicrobiales bacterium BCK34]
MSEANDKSTGDVSPPQPLEISSEIAAKADDLLRRFAEEAGLETALVVDRSGALVAGISSEAEVTIDVISALVAGASGAMRALVKELGETGNIESLHQGGDRLLYLREMINRFILVGVSDCSTPAGIVREEASKVSDALQELLADIRQSEPQKEYKELAPMKSLRSMSLQRTANRLLAPAIFLEDDEIPETPVEIVGKVEDPPVPAAPAPVEEPEPVEEPGLVDEPEMPPATELEPAPEIAPEVAFEVEEEIVIEETLEEDEEPVELEEPGLVSPDEGVAETVFEEIEEVEEFEEVEEIHDEAPEVEMEPVAEIPEPEPEPEPKEILEPLDFGEPEIVIEQPSLKKSPFEEVEFDEVPSEPAPAAEIRIGGKSVSSIFEMEADEEPGVAFELEPGEEEPAEVAFDEEVESESGSIFEVDEPGAESRGEDRETPPVAFEIDEVEEDHEMSDHDDDDDAEDDENDGESEGRAAGPFYF